MRTPLTSVSVSLDDAVRRAGVQDRRLLHAFRTIDRRGFVPSVHVSVAYDDEPIPIGHGQVTTQPSLIGQMIEALELSGGERALEVGTGFGYETAILATLARSVYSVERFADLAEQARRNLDRAGIRNATVVVGNGADGLPAYAPFQAIVLSAAAPTVPRALIEQLDLAGRLVQPIGHGGHEVVTLFRKQQDGLVEERIVTAASFVPLAGGMEA